MQSNTTVLTQRRAETHPLALGISIGSLGRFLQLQLYVFLTQTRYLHNCSVWHAHSNIYAASSVVPG